MRKKTLLCLFTVILFTGIAANYADPEDNLEKKVTLIEIDGTINPATYDYIRTGIDKSKENSSEALIIILDTPGGLLSSTK